MKRWMLAAATAIGLSLPQPVQAGGGGRWADKIVLDPMAASMLLVWFDNNVPSAERMSFGAVDAIHYVPAYEGRIEEVVLSMANGDQVLVAMGAESGQAALMVAAILGQRPQPQPADVERVVPAGVESDGPRLVLGAVDNETVMEPLSSRHTTSDMLSGMGIDAEQAIAEELTYEAPSNFVSTSDNKGSLERSAIELGIQSKMTTFRNCYQRQLQRTPNLPAGRVTVQFVIDADGMVDRARVASTSLQNTAVEGCIVQNLTGTQFPIPRNDGTVVVSYPFSFTRR